MVVVTLDVTPPEGADVTQRILTTVQRLQAEGFTVNSATVGEDVANYADLGIQEEYSPQRMVEKAQLEAQEMRGVTPDPVPEPEEEEDETPAEPEPEPAPQA